MVGRDGRVARTTYQPETAILRQLLHEVRERAGLKQVELAKMIGRSQPFISEYETGQRRLDLVELREICIACGTTLRKLVNEYERLLSGSR